MTAPPSIKEPSASQGHAAASLCLPFAGRRLWVRDGWCTEHTCRAGRNTDWSGNKT